MEFGLQIKEGKIQSEFAGIGESIANSFNRNNDIYFLKDIIKKINTFDKKNQESIKVHSSDYRYLKINGELTTSYFYNEFEDEGNPEIELGSIKTIELIPILSEFLELQIVEHPKTVQILDSIYSALDLLIDNKREMIHTYTKRMNYAEIYLNSGREVIDINYILKIYKLEFHGNKILLNKNRQYLKQSPLEFASDNGGVDKLILFLEKDLENWYNVKMKMFYDSENKLIVIPDEN